MLNYWILSFFCLAFVAFGARSADQDDDRRHPDEWLAAAIQILNNDGEDIQNEDDTQRHLRFSSNMDSNTTTENIHPCAEYIDNFFSEGPNCFQIKATTFAVAQCVEFPMNFGGGSFTRFFNLTSTPDGLVSGNWGTILDYNSSLPGFASEAVVGIVELEGNGITGSPYHPQDEDHRHDHRHDRHREDHTCSFVLVETSELSTFTGTVSSSGITYTQAQPGEIYGVSKGSLMRQDFRPDME